MITGRNKRPLEDHFDRNYELEEALRAQGRRDRLARVQESSDLATMHYVRQGDPRGLGHAVLCAEPHVGDQPFAVLLGDDLIDPRDPLLARMIEVQERARRQRHRPHGGRPRARSTSTAARPSRPPATEDVVRVTDLVEKPHAGRGAQQPRGHRPLRARPGGVRGAARRPQPGRGGEIQLTDALQTLAADRGDGRPGARRRLQRPPLRHRRPRRLPAAIVRLACEREDLGPDFRTWLRGTSPRRCMTPRRTRRPWSVERASRRHPRRSCAPLDPIELQLLDAQGCVLVEDVTVPGALPPFDNSSMDGYAVRAADIDGATEEHPAVARRSSATSRRAAASCPPVGPGQAARIMTGAPLPPGAEAVVPVEWTDGGTGGGPADRDDRAQRRPGGRRRRGAGPPAAPEPASTSAPAAATSQAGELALAAGTVLGPPQIGLLAAIGRGTVTGAAAPPRRGDVHRQRTRPARRGARPRADPRLQQLRAHRRRPRGRRHRLPGRRRRRRRRDAARHHRGPAHPRRHHRHQRRRQRRRVRRGQGGAARRDVGRADGAGSVSSSAGWPCSPASPRASA